MHPTTADCPEDSDTPGNKVVYAVSRAYGNCVHCAMLFPERLQRTVKRVRVGSDSLLASDVEMEEFVAASPGFVPDGIYREGDRAWYHVPNYGRKFFDALRKYYVLGEDGCEVRVLIKRPEKDALCTWIGVQGNPRNYSTGGKRSAKNSNDEVVASANVETLRRGRGSSNVSTVDTDVVMASTAGPASITSVVTALPPVHQGFTLPPPISTEPQRCETTLSENTNEFFGNMCNESPLSREILRNKNACMKLNALPDWFP